MEGNYPYETENSGLYTSRVCSETIFFDQEASEIELKIRMIPTSIFKKMQTYKP